MMFDLQQIPAESAPMGLLLEADPSEKNIDQYLSTSKCYAATLKEEIVGVCLVGPLSPTRLELYNIAIKPSLQGQGVGGLLLDYLLETIRSTNHQDVIKQIELSTGSFGHQLTFYQRHGFRVDHVVKDHFLINYSEPLYENGVQHKDMLRLICQL